MTYKLSLWLFFLTCFSHCALATELLAISNEQLLAMQKDQHALIVDIRTPSEWNSTGIIPHSQKLESFDKNGNFDLNAWLTQLQKLKSTPEQAVILVCRSGNRSQKVGNILLQHGQSNIYHLNNGIQSWIKQGFPVTSE
jgi:rhodanese-related sulfurtransferase